MSGLHAGDLSHADQKNNQTKAPTVFADDQDLSGPEPVCPICRTQGAHFFTEGHDRLFRLAVGRYRLYRCRHCLCVFQYPLPREEDIRGFYPEAYWWAGDLFPAAGFAGLLRRLERGYREFVAADHVRFLERCARRTRAGERALLDVGCGSGLFLALAQGSGFASHGMDVSARAVRVVREQYGIEARQGAVGDDVWEGLQFDFVTLFHVLEHLTDPGAALAYARALLKPGGSLIVQVPNLSSLQSRFFGSRWYGLDVPRHIINFTPTGLRLLLDKAGLVIESSARFSLRDNPASIASSLVPALDPIARAVRGSKTGALVKSVLDFGYFGLVLTCLPLALLESVLGLGGTIWVQARSKESQE